MGNSAIPAQVETWKIITTDQTLVAGQRVLCNGGVQLNLAVPATFEPGEIFEIGDMDGFGWNVTLGGGQQIEDFGAISSLGGTASGTGGKTIKLVGEVADTLLRIVEGHGMATLT